jgi:hypothetical protein
VEVSNRCQELLARVHLMTAVDLARSSPKPVSTAKPLNCYGTELFEYLETLNLGVREYRILFFLAIRPGLAFHVADAAKHCRMRRGSVWQALKFLHDKGLVTPQALPEGGITWATTQRFQWIEPHQNSGGVA